MADPTAVLTNLLKRTEASRRAYSKKKNSTPIAMAAIAIPVQESQRHPLHSPTAAKTAPPITTEIPITAAPSTTPSSMLRVESPIQTA